MLLASRRCRFLVAASVRRRLSLTDDRTELQSKTVDLISSICEDTINEVLLKSPGTLKRTIGLELDIMKEAKRRSTIAMKGLETVALLRRRKEEDEEEEEEEDNDDEEEKVKEKEVRGAEERRDEKRREEKRREEKRRRVYWISTYEPATSEATMLHENLSFHHRPPPLQLASLVAVANTSLADAEGGCPQAGFGHRRICSDERPEQPRELA